VLGTGADETPSAPVLKQVFYEQRPRVIVAEGAEIKPVRFHATGVSNSYIDKLEA